MESTMNPMQNKTPEERKAIAIKALATRRAKRDAKEAERQSALKYAAHLRQEIAALEAKLDELKRMEAMNCVSAVLTGKSLLRAEEITAASMPWKAQSGIYFLVDKEDVVYVGQSVNVHQRIAQHTEKQFDRYAFVPCDVGHLNILESLYIHCLRPRLNGNQSDGPKYAPISLGALLGLAHK